MQTILGLNDKLYLTILSKIWLIRNRFFFCPSKFIFYAFLNWWYSHVKIILMIFIVIELVFMIFNLSINDHWHRYQCLHDDVTKDYLMFLSCKRNTRTSLSKHVFVLVNVSCLNLSFRFNHIGVCLKFI